MNKLINRIPAPLATFLEKYLKKIPAVQNRVDQEIGGLVNDLEDTLKPYQKTNQPRLTLPEKPLSREDILTEIEDLNNREEDKWKNGFVSGAVYHGDREHIEFLNRVYAITSQSNPLHSDIWPSASKYEAEIIQMTAKMLSAEAVDGQAVGTVTSGGTESILLAMKTYRDAARETRGIRRPEMVIPVTAHPAFDKAAQYFNIKARHVPVDKDFRAIPDAVKQLINKNTIVIVGSTPSFPHGAIDPIPEMSELARQHNIGFHTDACLGGFVLPWAEKLGYEIPLFDFRLKGVTSISVDTHKYGYAPKGSSVILYRDENLRHFQYYTIADWPGGLYFSPTFAGSRPGALSASCWAAMLSIGEEGYLKATQKILETAAEIKKGIESIPELYILGKPLWVIAFGSDSIDIYRVMDEMSKKGWSLNGLHKPVSVHIALTLRHTEPGVSQRFIADLETAVRKVKKQPTSKGGMAPIYGLAATIPTRGIVADMLKKYLDLYYKT